MVNQQIANPTVLPVTIDRIKDHLRVRHSLEDTLYLDYLAAATQLLEERTERVFIAREFRMTLDSFCPDGYQYIEIPVTPLGAIAKIEYYDSSDSLVTMDAADYFVEPETLIPSRVYSSASTWPSTKIRRDAVAIEYTAGHGLTPSEIPSKVRLVLCQLVEHFNRNRGVVETSGLSELPLSTRALINSLKIGSYA